jgi:hypothetical protein
MEEESGTSLTDAKLSWFTLVNAVRMHRQSHQRLILTTLDEDHILLRQGLVNRDSLPFETGVHRASCVCQNLHVVPSLKLMKLILILMSEILQTYFKKHWVLGWEARNTSKALRYNCLVSQE